VTTITRRAADLRPGDVISLGDAQWGEVRAVEPIDLTQCVRVLLAGGEVISPHRDDTRTVAAPEAAEQWRRQRDATARRQQLAAELSDLADMIRDGRIPAHTSGAAIQLFGLSRDEVVALAATLGVQPPEATSGGRNVILRTDLRPGSLLAVTAVAAEKIWQAVGVSDEAA